MAHSPQGFSPCFSIQYPDDRKHVLVTITHGRCWIRPCVIALWFTLFLDPLILGSFELQSSQPHIPVARWKDKGKEKKEKSTHKWGNKIGIEKYR